MARRTARRVPTRRLASVRRPATLLAFAAIAAVTVGFQGSKDQRRVIYVRNDSALTNLQIEAALPAIQKALERDYAPAWGVDARLQFIGRRSVPRGAWRIVLVNYPNCVGCGGFHEWKGFARAEVGADGWQLTLTHELWEMLVDPKIENDGSWGYMIASGDCAYLVETADPVEEDSYKVDGVTISDFALPNWYTGEAGKYDFLGLVTAPHVLRPGGYAWAICGNWRPV